MILDIKERLYLIDILPGEGSFLENMAKESITKKVLFTDEELNAVKFKTTEKGGLEWDQTKAVALEVEFNISEKELLKSIYENLDKERKIKRDMMSLFTKIKQEAC